MHETLIEKIETLCELFEAADDIETEQRAQKTFKLKRY